MYKPKVVRVIRSFFCFGIQGGSFLEFEAFFSVQDKQKGNLDIVHFLAIPTPITAPAVYYWGCLKKSKFVDLDFMMLWILK